MKKFLLFLFLITAFSLTSCDYPIVPGQGESSMHKDNTSAASDAVDPLLEGYLTEDNLLETPVHEYGESTSYLLMADDLVVRILYPTGEISQLNESIENWITDTVAYYHSTEPAQDQKKEEAAELTVEYSSYLIDQRLVGVKLTGIYDSSYLAHPVEVIATFNASLESGRLLSLEETLVENGEERLRNMVIELADVDPAFADENLLKHWLLTPEGLEITLARGEYLPMSAGTKTLVFPYQEICDIFALPDGSSQTPASPDPNKPMLALTFDDGPSAHTDRLLDTFAQHGGKGTFFVLGNLIDERPETVKRITDEGHEIGGHSWNHRQFTKLGEEEVLDQIMGTRAKIYEVTGVDTPLLRPPYGSYNDQIKATAEELGVILVNWSVDTLDWKYKDADKMYDTVMEQAADGAIILCHDLEKSTVDAMERIIPDLIAQGYQLVTVSELLTSDGEVLIPGNVYRKK